MPSYNSIRYIELYTASIDDEVMVDIIYIYTMYYLMKLYLRILNHTTTTKAYKLLPSE